MPFEKAVADMTRRAPDNQDLKIFALSVIVQKETGGNLVEIIEKIADTVRSPLQVPGQAARADRRRPHVQLHPRRAAVRLAAVHAGREPRLHHAAVQRRPSGTTCLATAIISWTLGFLWMRKMIKVKM